MKITVSAKPFAACLKAVLPAIATRPGLPILSGVRLDASEVGLKVEGTDLELTARRRVPDATIQNQGIVVRTRTSVTGHTWMPCRREQLVDPTARADSTAQIYTYSDQTPHRRLYASKEATLAKPKCVFDVGPQCKREFLSAVRVWPLDHFADNEHIRIEAARSLLKWVSFIRLRSEHYSLS